jgi:hypothetical protein
LRRTVGARCRRRADLTSAAGLASGARLRRPGPDDDQYDQEERQQHLHGNQQQRIFIE